MQRLRPACAYAQSDQSLCLSLEYSRLLTEQHLVFLILKGGCIGSSKSTLVKIPHFWKSHVTAHFTIVFVDHYGEYSSCLMSYFMLPILSKINLSHKLNSVTEHTIH